MLSRKILDPLGTQREERNDRYSPLRFAFSVSALGISAATSIAIYRVAGRKWSQFYKHVEKYTKTPAPPNFIKDSGREQKHSMMYHYYREYHNNAFDMIDTNIQNTNIPKDIMTRHYDNHTLSKSIMLSREINEVSQLENTLLNRTDGSIYREAAIQEAFGGASGRDAIINGRRIDPKLAMVESPEYTSKYRKALRKYHHLYNRVVTSGDNTSQRHEDAIKKFSSRAKVHGDLETEILEIGAPKWSNIELEGLRGIGKGYTSFSKRLNLLDSKGAFSTQYLNDLGVSKKVTGRMVGVKGEIDKLYRSLHSSLSKVYQNLDYDRSVDIKDPFTIEHEFVNMGRGEVSLKLKIRAKSVVPNDPTDPIKVFKLGRTTYDREIMIPIGYVDELSSRYSPINRLSSSFNYDRVVSKMVMRETGDYRIEDARTRVIGSLASKSERIVQGITTGNTRMFDRAIRDAMEVGQHYASRATGGPLDVVTGTSIVYPSVYYASPLSLVSESQRRVMTNEIRRLTSEIQSLDVLYTKALDSKDTGRVTQYSGLRSELNAKVNALRMRLSTKEGPAERLRMSGRLMTDIMNGSKYAGGYPWEGSGSHPGSVPTLSVFGYSPMSFFLSASSQPYQNVNIFSRLDPKNKSLFRYIDPRDLESVADVTDDMLTSGKIRHTGSMLMEENYVRAWGALVVNDIYPLDQGQHIMEKELLDELANPQKVVTMDNKNIKIPKGTSVPKTLSGKLNPLIKKYTGDGIDKEAISNKLGNSDIVIKYGDPLYVTPSGRVKRYKGSNPVRITDLNMDDGNLILTGQSQIDSRTPMRIRSEFGGVKSISVPSKINAFPLPYNGMIQYMSRINIEKKVTMAALDLKLVEGAFDSSSREYLRILGAGDYKSAGVIRRKIETAIRKLGGGFNPSTGEIYVIGMHPDHAGYKSRFQDILSKLTPDNVDSILRDLDWVYSEGDPLISLTRDSAFRNNIRSMIHDKFGDQDQVDIDKYIDKYLPSNGIMAGMAKRLVVANGSVAIPTYENLGSMRQIATDTAKVFQFGRSPHRGIQMNWHELTFFMHNYTGLSAEAEELASKVAGGFATHFGGSKAMKEYNDLLMMAKGIEPPSGAKILKMADTVRASGKNVVLSELLEKINKSMSELNSMWQRGITPLNLDINDTDMDSLVNKMADSTMINDALDMGIDIRGLMGQWIELERPITMPNGTTTRFIKIPDIRKMKVKPTTVSEFIEYQTRVVRGFSNIMDIITGRAGLDPNTLPNYLDEASKIFDTPIRDNEVLSARRKRGSIKWDPRRVVRSSSRSNLPFNVDEFEKPIHSGKYSKAFSPTSSRKLFVDIETSGLDVNTDNIHMIGMGYVDDAGKFHQKILSAKDRNSEKYILEAFADFADQFDEIVTFNGKNYDMRAITSRSLATGMDEGKVNRLSKIHNLDIYDKLKGSTWASSRSNRLVDLTNRIYGITRPDDMPSATMPGLWNEFFRTTDETRKRMILNNIVHHNVDDIVDTVSVTNTIMDGGFDLLSSTNYSDRNIAHRSLTDIWEDVYNDPEKMMRMGKTLQDSVELMMAQTLGRHGFIRDYVLGGKLPGIQGVISALPQDLDDLLGPYDIGIIRDPNSKLFRETEKLVRSWVKGDENSKLSGKGSIDMDLVNRRTDAILSGKERIPIMLQRAPKSGPQAISAAYLKIINIDKDIRNKLDREGKLPSRGSDVLYPSLLIQHAVAGDLDYDIVQAMFDAMGFSNTPLSNLLEGPMSYTEGIRDLAVKETKTLKYSVGGTPKIINVPKIYKLVASDTDIGKYKAMVYDVGEDGLLKNIRSTVTNELAMKELVDAEGNRVILDGTDLINILEGELEDRNFTNASLVRSTLNRLGDLPDDIKARATKLQSTADNIIGEKMVEQLAMQAQKAMTGSSTAYIMAMDLLAAQKLGDLGAANIAITNFNILQSFLGIKKASAAELSRKLDDFGRYVDAFKNVERVDDLWGRRLHNIITDGGKEKHMMQRTIDTIRDIARMSKSDRINIFNATTTLRDALKSTNMEPGKALEKMYAIWDDAEKMLSSMESGGKGIDATGKYIGLTEQLLDVMGTMGMVDANRVKNTYTDAVNKVGKSVKIDERKPLFGKFFKKGHLTTDVENTRIADALGKDHGKIVKGAIVGGAAIGGLYLMYNFFRPNQMGMLGEMPGTGGETWDYFSGSRMELPRHIPIDIGNYTWDDPRYGKKARVTPYNPVLAEKMELFRSDIRRNVIAPVLGGYNSNYTTRTYTRTNDNRR